MRNFNLKEFLKKSAQEFQKPEKKKEIFHQSKAIEVDEPIKKITKPYKEVDTFELEGELGDEQKKLFELMEYGSDHQAMFITGKAGTGKSYLLDYFVKHTRKEVAVVAPTGVAALNVGGQTIHSFFVLPAHVLNPNEPLEMSSKVRNILKALETLIIDEVSMVSSDLMRAINRSMQEANKSKEPFGGKQVIMFGDLYQLPPVIPEDNIRKFLKDNYGSIFFFGAPVIKEHSLKIYELSHIYRQKDPDFVKILNGIRDGNFNLNHLEILNKRHTEVDIPEEGVLTLFTTNEEVDDLNNQKLKEISEKEYTYEAELKGYFEHAQKEGKLKRKDLPTEIKLRLKVGAQVMLVRNDTRAPEDIDNPNWKPRWVNGSLGIVTDLGDDHIRVAIDEISYYIPQTTWEKIRYEYNPDTKHLDRKITGTFKQYPVKLAWAVTIHKSQGQTYKSVAVNLGKRTFASGQAYVALSRCVDINTLYLHRPIRKDDIKVNKEVLEFMSKAEKIDYNN